jgi:hypothetical protein
VNGSVEFVLRALLRYWDEEIDLRDFERLIADEIDSIRVYLGDDTRESPQPRDMTGDFYSTPEAAAYLGLSVSVVKHHIYQTKRLRPDGKVGKNMVFTKRTLDAFKGEARKGGRPPGTGKLTERLRLAAKKRYPQGVPAEPQDGIAPQKWGVALSLLSGADFAEAGEANGMTRQGAYDAATAVARYWETGRVTGPGRPRTRD